MKNFNETEMTPEFLAKIKECAGAEELVKLAADNNVELSLADAEKYLSKGAVALGDDELGKVAGGARYRF